MNTTISRFCFKASVSLTPVRELKSQT